MERTPRANVHSPEKNFHWKCDLLCCIIQVFWLPLNQTQLSGFGRISDLKWSPKNACNKPEKSGGTWKLRDGSRNWYGLLKKKKKKSSIMKIFYGSARRSAQNYQKNLQIWLHSWAFTELILISCRLNDSTNGLGTSHHMLIFPIWSPWRCQYVCLKGICHLVRVGGSHILGLNHIRTKVSVLRSNTSVSPLALLSCSFTTSTQCSIIQMNWMQTELIPWSLGCEWSGSIHQFFCDTVLYLLLKKLQKWSELHAVFILPLLK